MHEYSGSFLGSTCLAALLGASIASAPALAASEFQDPLDTPAQMRKAVETRPLLAIVHAGNALVAVGSRGMIIRSEDEGKTWAQSAVPVQSDLLAVHFPNPQDGWAVGHDGVILRSSDGGKTWKKQLDGRIAGDAFKKFYASQPALAGGNVAAAQIEQNFKGGATAPWLDVWFEDADRGFVVGAFGMIAATVDGGRRWEPWLHRIDNDQALHLNGVRGVGRNVYVAGERGMVFKLDRERRRFQGAATGYTGSFFGIVGKAETLLAFGLRGVVYRSGDGGATWEALKLPAGATVTAGSVSADSGGFVLVNSAGQFLLGDAQGRSFRVADPANAMRYTGVVLASRGAAVVTGLGGVRTEALSGNAK